MHDKYRRTQEKKDLLTVTVKQPIKKLEEIYLLIDAVCGCEDPLLGHDRGSAERSIGTLTDKTNLPRILVHCCFLAAHDPADGIPETTRCNGEIKCFLKFYIGIKFVKG